MKKIFAIVMTLAIVLSLCACGAGNSNLGNKYNEEGKVTLSIGMATSAKVTDLENNSLTKWLEEQTGYELKIVEYSGGTDVPTQISTTIAARQDLPDILWGITLPSETLSTYGREEYFVDLKPFFDDKEGASKNFWDRYEECLNDYQKKYVMGKLVDMDTGGIYAVPTVETSLVDGQDFTIWINQEWLDYLKLDAPTNTEELYNVLVAFRDGDPNQNGKKDEIPLYGTQTTTGPNQVVNWLINLFMYFNANHLWQDYDGDGKIEHAGMQDSYREALKFVNKLYKEKLLTNMVFTATATEMKTVTTPSSGTALCGIFAGHLTSHTAVGNELLYQYKSLKTWGCATERDVGFNPNCYITETAQKRDVVAEAFNLLMTMWSWEGSMRIRYGEYGYNWVEPDPGAISDYGIPATYKLLIDPFTEQGSIIWGGCSGSLNHYAEGESAQTPENMNPWSLAKQKMLAEARKNFDDAAANINPKYMQEPFLQAFQMTGDEYDSILMARTNFNSIYTTYYRDFICGTNGQDINDDGDWNAYLDKLKSTGYKETQAMYQICYDRQK